jgi:hypothetical protein
VTADTCSKLPVHEWRESYSGLGEGGPRSLIIHTKDGVYLQIGDTGFIEDESARICVVKVDSTGKIHVLMILMIVVSSGLLIFHSRTMIFDVDCTFGLYLYRNITGVLIVDCYVEPLGPAILVGQHKGTFNTSGFPNTAI